MAVPIPKTCNNRWMGNNPSWNSQNGIITFTVDHRGSGQFGKKGLDYMHRSLGKWEILDYADAVKWLRQKPFVDASRMGITGSSYGGYMTLSGSYQRCRLLDTWFCRIIGNRLEVI